MRIAVVLACLLVAVPAMAEDLVLRQRSNVGGAGGSPRDETVYITQRKVVNDAPGMRTIVDLDAGTITIADKTKRTYSTMTLDQLAAQMEALRRELDKLPPEQKRMMGALFEDEAPVVVKATGRTETIAGLPAAEHTLKGGPYDGVVWTTTAITVP